MKRFFLFFVCAVLLPLAVYSQQTAPPAALPANLESEDDACREAVLSALYDSRSFWQRQVRFDDFAKAMQKAQSATISPAKALALLEAYVEQHFDNPSSAYHGYHRTSRLCFVVGDFYYFSNQTPIKWKGKIKGWFVNMTDGSVTHYESTQLGQYDPPYTDSLTLLLLEIGEERRPATLAVERFNATLPKGQPPYSHKLYNLEIGALSSPDAEGTCPLDQGSWYRVIISRKNRKKSLGGGRFICIIHRETGEIVSVSRDR